MNAKRQINDRQDSWTAGNKERGMEKGEEYAKMREEISCLAVFIAQISEIKTEVNLSSKIVECGEQSIVDYIVEFIKSDENILRYSLVSISFMWSMRVFNNISIVSLRNG